MNDTSTMELSTPVKKRYFGTDGIRGKVGIWPITPEFVLKLGWAIGKVLARKGSGKVLIGKDTRISGYMFESVLEAGLSAAGIDSWLLGPMPTPAIAYLTRTFRADAGIVISASHNPFEDNGIKFFSASGTKLPNDVEFAIEEQLEKPMTTVDSAQIGKALRINDAPGRYIEFCKSTVNSDMMFTGLKIVVDCAHGAAYHIAPSVFRELGAEVIEIGVDPNGLNINQLCGATYPKYLSAAVLEAKADLGIALDGDGDRTAMVDANGDILDGDDLLYIIACCKKRRGIWSGGVVGTVMTNLGLENALNALDIDLIRVPVGDRHIINELIHRKWLLGGEPSGHLVCMERISTGDGIVTALQILAAMHYANQSLAELKQGLKKYPQVLINIPISNSVDWQQNDSIKNEINKIQNNFAKQRGRVLLRKSGTESLLRLMVEGENATDVKAAAEHLASILRIYTNL